MLSKNDAKDIQSLCHKKHRDERQLFVAEGPKLIAELLKSNFKIERIYALKEWMNENRNVTEPVVEIAEAELKKISTLQTPNKVLAVVRQKELIEEPVLKDGLTMVLDGIQDPGNLGTIIRIADWFGVKQIVASDDTVEVYNPKVVQSTMGSICRVTIWYKNLEEWISNVGGATYGALLNGQSVYEVGKVKEGVLVIGNESKGIRRTIARHINYPVTIPRIGEAESLNAAVATGIILSHLR